jgi:hypothetical protein
VYISGSSNDCPGAGPGTDFATIKYNPITGAQVWLRRYNGPSNSLDDCEDMIVDNQNGSIYVTGRAKKDGIIQPCLIKYDTAGNLEWERFPLNNIDGTSRAVALDDSGNVYIAGINSISSQGFVIKYNGTGNIKWQEFYPMPSNDDWREVMVDDNYNVFARTFKLIAKYCQQPSQTNFIADNDSLPPGYAFAFTNASINAVHWLWDFGDGNTDTVNYNASHAYSSEGLYTVKLKTWNACGEDSATILVNVDSAFVGIEDVSASLNMITVFPNPVTSELTLTFGKEGQYQIQLSNTLGEVLITQNCISQKHSVNVSALPRGVYFLEVRDKKNHLSVRKFVKI